MTPYVTGPAAFYVAPNLAGTPQLLGYCETAPRIRITPRYSPVMSDLAGDQIPADWLYQGADADILGDLTIWNWSVLELLMSRPSTTANSAGVDLEGAVGSLMVGEGFAKTLWVQFPYASKTLFSGQMPAGYRFVATWLMGPDEFDMGTKANKVHVQFHAARTYKDGKWTLYDHDMTGIPLLPPTGILGV